MHGFPWCYSQRLAQSFVLQSCSSVLVLWTLSFIQVLPSVLLRRLLSSTPCVPTSPQHRFAPSTVAFAAAAAAATPYGFATKKEEVVVLTSSFRSFERLSGILVAPFS